MSQTPARPVRLGFIGCGSHARTNLYPCLRFADCELLAVADLYAEHRDYCRRAFGAQRVYDSHETLLDAEDELDAVIVCGPPELHTAATLAALQRGLHVLVEKPPATTLAQTLELQAAASLAGRTLMVAFMKRFAQKYVMARALAATADFGPVRHLHLQYGYNVKLDARRTATLMCIHALDLVHSFMGLPSRVTIERSEDDGHTSFSLLYRFPSGATGTLLMPATAAGVTERLELTGTGATLVVDEVAHLSHYPRNAAAWSPPRAEVHSPNFALQTNDNSTSFLQGYAGEIIEFVSSVRDGRPPGGSGIADAVAAMRLVELMVAHGSGTFDLD